MSYISQKIPSLQRILAKFLTKIISVQSIPKIYVTYPTKIRNKFFQAFHNPIIDSLYLGFII